MSDGLGATRRSLLRGAAAAGLLSAASAVGVAGSAAAATTADVRGNLTEIPLWRTAANQGILYGSSTATWQISDPEYRSLVRRETAVLLTGVDLLWYRLKPTPDADLDFTSGDRIVAFAEGNGQLVLGAHLVRDQGFGDGWKHGDLWGLTAAAARELLFDAVRGVVCRYRGRVPIWSVVNEAIVNGRGEGVRGLRNDVPWYRTIGPDYVAASFYVAHEADRDACLLMNDFGYETVDQYGNRPEVKRRATLQVIDQS